MQTTKLSPFIRGYLDAVFFTEGEELSELSVSDIAPETLATIVEECQAFQETAAELLARAHELRDYTEEQAGIDFWLTRNGHGAGFWDRGLGAIGTELTALAKPYGEAYAYVGDDGRIYVS